MGSVAHNAGSLPRIHGDWAVGAAMPTKRQEITATLYEERVYTFGGLTHGKTVDTVEIYDIASDRWETARPMPVPLDHTFSVSADDRIFLLGGSLSATNEVAGETLEEMAAISNWDFSPRANVWVYHPPEDRYGRAAPMPLPRLGHSAVLCGKHIFVVGGQGPNPGAMMRYDIQADRWDYLPGMPTLREHQAMVTYEDRFYVIGGRWPDPTNPRSTFLFGQLNTAANEVYDPGSGLWGVRAPLPTPRGAGYGALLDGLIYVAGGEVLDSPERYTFGEVEAFDPKTNAWYTAPPLPTPRHGLGVVSNGQRLFVMGGGPKAAWDECDTLEVFTPTGRDNIDV